MASEKVTTFLGTHRDFPAHLACPGESRAGVTARFSDAPPSKRISPARRRASRVPGREVVLTAYRSSFLSILYAEWSWQLLLPSASPSPELSEFGGASAYVARFSSHPAAVVRGHGSGGIASGVCGPDFAVHGGAASQDCPVRVRPPSLPWSGFSSLFSGRRSSILIGVGIVCGFPGDRWRHFCW